MRSKLGFPGWIMFLPIQQQNVIMLGSRGPDGAEKHNPAKAITRAYRGTVFLAAKYGRMIKPFVEGDTFMDVTPIFDSSIKAAAFSAFFDMVDSLPHHYTAHIAHGAQIIGYKCPHEPYASFWMDFYLAWCKDGHVNPETREQMDARLNDWGQEHWAPPERSKVEELDL